MTLFEKWTLKCLAAMANTRYPEEVPMTKQVNVWEKYRGWVLRFQPALGELTDKAKNNLN